MMTGCTALTIHQIRTNGSGVCALESPPKTEYEVSLWDSHWKRVPRDGGIHVVLPRLLDGAAQSYRAGTDLTWKLLANKPTNNVNIAPGFPQMSMMGQEAKGQCYGERSRLFPDSRMMNS
jgi:hypothetical protein